MEIHYHRSCENIFPEMLNGFFVGWSNPPSPATHLRMLRAASAVELAVDAPANRVVGFCTALSDGVLTAEIVLLEVLPQYQKRGIGTRLTHRMLDRFTDLYSVNVLCDPGVQPFYSRFGMRPCPGMIIRRYARQCG